jgi:hypothetical protein
MMVHEWLMRGAWNFDFGFYSISKSEGIGAKLFARVTPPAYRPPLLEGRRGAF